MAAPVAVAGSSPGLCPSFAVVCSFLERYGAALDLPELTFPQMERYLQETSIVPKPLVELHVKLLRKIGKCVTPDRWEKYLVKVCQEFNCTWAWELERKGYSEMTVESKTEILKYLCECQFDDNIKFKTSVNEEDPDRMRLQPIGKDKEGLMYWFQLDPEQNVRIYVEEQDDLDGASWKCIVRNRSDLAQTLEKLKAQIDLGSAEKNQHGGSTCASPLPEDGGNDADNKENKTEPEIKKEPSDGPKNEEPVITELPVSRDSKEAPREQEEKLNSVVEKDEDNIEMEMKVINKTEVKSEVKSEEKPVIDNRVSTIMTLVKEESKDSEVAWNAVSVVMAPGSIKKDGRGGVKAEVRGDESGERTLEQVERALKSDQQAKIPLKKRELKLSEGFGNSMNNSNSNHHPNNSLNNNGTMSSGIIVRNPSVLALKGPSWTPREEDSNGEEGRAVVSSSVLETTGVGLKRDARLSLCNGEMAPGRNLSPNVREHRSMSVGVIMGPVDRRKSYVEPNIPVIEDKGGVVAVNCIKTVASHNNKERTGDPTVQVERIPSPGAVRRQSVLVRKAATPDSVVSLLTDDGFESQGSRRSGNDLGKVDKNSSGQVKENSSSCPEIISIDDTIDVDDLSKTSSPQAIEDVALHSPAENDIDEDEKEKIVDMAESQSKAKDESKTPEGIERSPRALSKDSDSGSSGDDDGSEAEGLPEGTDEVSSEIQKEGIRLKIKIPMHRRTPEFQRERTPDPDPEPEQEQEQQEASGDGHSLRRSARICRPSPKLAEIQDRRQEKSGKHAAAPSGAQEEKEPREGDMKKTTSQRRESPRKSDSDGQHKLGKVRRRHRRPRWSNQRCKARKKGPGEGGEELMEACRTKESSYQSDREQHPSDPEVTLRTKPMTAYDDPCTHCGLPNHPELILLCDLCDHGYHTACLRPPLMIIPDGEWFCPPCQHKLLCERLEEQLANLDTALKKRERAERRRERLVYVGISVENIIPTPDGELEGEKMDKKKSTKKSKNLERRSTRTRKSISYRFDDFDDAIDEAIEEDVRETETEGTGQGNDMATIAGKQKREEGKENQRPAKPLAAAVARRKKRRRLNDLDSDSTVDEEESENDFNLSSSTDEEDFVVSGDEAPSDVDVGSNDCSDWGSTASRPSQTRRTRRTASVGQARTALSRTRGRTQGRGRSGRSRHISHRHRGGLSDEEEEEEDELETEEEEEEMETEGSSDCSDSDVSTRRRRSRRSQRSEVNYCETSESEGSKKGTKKQKQPQPQPHRRRLCSSNSEGSAEDEKGEKEEEEQQRRRRRRERRQEFVKDDSRRLPLKRRRHSSDEENDNNSGAPDDSDDDSEEERPVRKRLNRIESEDEEEEEEGGEEDEREEDEEEEEEEDEREIKKASSIGTNASIQSPNRHSASAGRKRGGGGGGGHLASKNNASSRHNGLAPQRASAQDEDDDFYDGVTDIVHLVFNSEQAL
ncbi:remodeling and spacing factor 1 [Engraulis encrasicolus]|uniref:remodeling and spacing factor 1 n=1 Tax=Engraulis encrasicolus TaxID=184585 RepID=UPI002FD42E2D